MQAIEIERSPGLPSLMVTTRRRLIPQGTSCSFLQAVTQALHSMQRSASQRNFIRAMAVPSLRRSDLAESSFWFLHARHRIEAVGCERVDALAEHHRVGALRILGTQILALVPATEVERAPRHTLADAFRDKGFDAGARLGVGRAVDPYPGAIGDTALGRIGRIDLDEHV